MSDRLNIYGLGAPKTASTSFNKWLGEVTNYEVFTHDAMYTSKIHKFKANGGQCWTGGSFWSPNLLEHLDSNGLWVLAVRASLEDWLLSFFAHFYDNPKIGIGRTLSIWPCIGWSHEIELSQPDWHPDTFQRENYLLRISREASMSAELKGHGFAIEHRNAAFQILDVYVKQHMEIARQVGDNPERHCVISLDEGRTTPKALAKWLRDRLPPESLVESAEDVPWPHLRKTDPARHVLAENSPGDVPIREFITKACEPYVAQWEDEIVSRIMSK